MLGGKVRDKVPAYANGWYTVERTADAFAGAAQKVVDKGYLGMKFDPFGNGDLELTRPQFHRSIELIEAVSAVAGRDCQIFVEMHGRFAPHQAVEVAKAIEHLNPGWIEEPCRPEDVPAALIRHGPHRHPRRHRRASLPRVAIPRAIRKTGRPHHSPDINQCGGLLEVKKIASWAEQYSIMVAPHNVGGIISTTAALHLMLTLRNGKILEHFNDFVDPIVKECGAPYPEVIDGYFHPPTGAGWGVEINEDFLKDNPPTTADGVICDPGLNLFVKENWADRRQK